MLLYVHVGSCSVAHTLYADTLYTDVHVECLRITCEPHCMYMYNSGSALTCPCIYILCPPGCCYSLEVTTGSCPGAGTTANVYVQLHGNGSSSGRVWLQGSGRGFRAGQTDSFDVLSPCLVSPLETITVGHDNKGSEPGWFLEKVAC